MSPAAAVLAVVTLVVTMNLVSTAASADENRVVVRVYDTGAAAPDLRLSAIRTAAAILDEAGIAVEWHDCTDARSVSCQRTRPAHDLIVRIMPFSAGAMSAHAAELHASTKGSDFPLGFAVVDPATRTGSMATIFHDQVLSVARRSGIASRELLGRAIAHEVGHLLLRTMGHSRTGLMRAVWTDTELTTNRHEDWVFSPPER
jgi:hypothetical protein